MDPRPFQDSDAAAIRAELEHHLACARAELEREGLTPAAAAAEAERRFGARERVEAECLAVAVHRRNSMRSRLHALVTTALLLSTLSLAYALHLTRAAAEEAHSLARQASQTATETREQAVLASRIHPVWKEWFRQAQVDPRQTPGAEPLTPQEAESLRGLGYTEPPK